MIGSTKLVNGWFVEEYPRTRLKDGGDHDGLK